jgi:rhamnosyltransferase
VTLIKGNEKTNTPAGNFLRLLQIVPLEEYDFIGLCDQDDIWLPKKLLLGIEYMLINSADGYSSNLITFSIIGRKYLFNILNKSQNQCTYDYLFQGASAGCTYIFTKKLAVTLRDKLIKTTAEEMKFLSHDWLVYAICRNAGLKWVHDTSSNILYRQHSSNAWGSNTGINGIFRRIKLAKSGWYKSHILALKKFIDLTEGEKDIFIRIERLNLVDRLILSFSTTSFRRSKKDAFLLSIAIIFKIF